jgi:hypothetical protein
MASACWRDVMLPACRSLPAAGTIETTRYPSIAAAVAAVPCRSCLIEDTSATAQRATQALASRRLWRGPRLKLVQRISQNETQ